MSPGTAADDPVALVHGDAAQAALGVAAAELGGRLVAQRTRTVEHRPGRGATAAYDVTVRLDATGEAVRHVIALSTDVSPVQGAPGTLVLTAGGTSLGVWRVPHDPHLPGLVPAYDTGAVAALLSRLGVGCDAADVGLRLRSYRPGRRAVVEANARGRRVYLKVVPPTEGLALHDRHRGLTAAGVPAPDSAGWDASGVVVLTELRGSSWRELLVAGTDGPPVTDLWCALDTLPNQLVGEPVRAPWAQQTTYHADVVAAALPELAERVHAAAAAADVGAEVAGTPMVPVHGDLYEAQVVVDAGRLVGVLDLDTAGPGHRVDDEACLLAHLALLPSVRPGAHDPCARVAAQVLVTCADDPALLWQRAAAALLTLATGPVRTRHHQWQRHTESSVAMVERWLARDPRWFTSAPSEALRWLVGADLDNGR